MYNYNTSENKKAYRTIYPILLFLAKTFYNVKIVGKENIDNKNYLITFNHISHIDFIFVPSSKKTPDVHFLAMSELFKRPLQGAFLDSLNCFPVERGNGKSKIAVEHMIELLKRGHNVAMSPEGKINKTPPYAPDEAKSGVARIALEAKVDVLPCCIYCNGKMTPFKKVIVSFGEPIKYEEIKDEFIKENDYKATAKFIFSKTKKLWENSKQNV